MELVVIQLLKQRKTNAKDDTLQIGTMEEIIVIRTFRGPRTINWFATRKAELLKTFLALRADDAAQIFDIYLKRGLGER